MHGAVGSGTPPPLLPTHTPEDLAGHQDDYGLLSQLFQFHIFPHISIQLCFLILKSYINICLFIPL